jgi:AcrR family transcriptional regulator
MTTPANRPPEPRIPLSRERILRAAVDLADNGGIAALSMRKLGQELGVDAMMLYRRVANRDDLLAGMVDIVFGEIGLPPPGTDWKAAMRERAVAARAVLARHPWAIGLMESRRRPGPATLQHHDAVLASLRHAGFSLEAAAHAYSLLDSYIYGFALNEQSLPLDTPGQVAEVGENILREFPVNAYPYLAEFIGKHAMRPGYSYRDEFTFGLDLILDGLERVRERHHVASQREATTTDG